METQKQKIKLLFVEETSKIGGAQINEIYLQKYLNRDKFESLVVCPSTGPLTEELQKIKSGFFILPVSQFFSTSVRIGGRLFFNPFALFWNVLTMIPLVFSLAKKIREFSPDFIVTNGMLAHCYGGAAARLAGRPCIWLLADIIRPELAFGMIKLFFQWIASFLPEKIVCVSQAVKNEIKGRFRLGDKTIIIHNGVDLERFDPQKTDTLRQEWKIPNHFKVVGIMSRLTPWKGHREFIHAAKIVSEQYENVRFLIVGGTVFENKNYVNELRQKAEELGLKDKIIFTDFRRDIPNCIQSMDICIVPSVLPEPFGLVALEAMAMAKPVIAAHCGGLPEIVVDGETGLLVPPGDSRALADSILQLLKDEKEIDRMGKAGRLRAEKNFGAQRFVEAHEALFLEMQIKTP